MNAILLPVGTIENMSEKSQRGKYLNKRFTLDGERQDNSANEAKAADCHRKTITSQNKIKD